MSPSSSYFIRYRDREVWPLLKDRRGGLEELVRYKDLLIEKRGWDAVNVIQCVFTLEDTRSTTARRELAQSVMLFVGWWRLVLVEETHANDCPSLSNGANANGQRPVDLLSLRVRTTSRGRIAFD